MPKVILKKASYDYGTLRPLFFGLMDSLGGGMIGRGSRVLIKPNLLAPAAPDRAVVTHPLIVKAAVEYVLERGALPRVSDSPAIGSFEKVLKESGIGDALKGLEAEAREFRETKTVDIGGPFNRIEIARAAFDADAIINLPKLKTHTQMLLTLGVKNLFGCIVGLRKPEWHFRTGVDREMFARLLVLICKAIKPHYTILDGILAMEGQGPGKGGTPRELGILMGSNDPFALDSVVCRMFGMETDKLSTNRIAGELGLIDGPVMVEGSLPGIKDFRFPQMSPLVFGPKPLHGLMRKHLVQRPVADAGLCRLCGECWRYCPAKAIMPDKRTKRLAFDYEACIRCYCCIEVCPHSALRAIETVPGRMIRKLTRRSK